MLGRRAALALFILSLLVGCSRDSSDPRTQPDPALSAAIDSLFTQAIGRDDPGAAVLVAGDGILIHAAGYGLADASRGVPITPTTNIRVASVSKQFTAMAVLTLIDQGLLSLGDSIRTFFGAPVFEGITIEHLLTHTSGLPDNEAVFMEEWDRAGFAENKDVLAWYVTAAPPLEFTPGASWDYSNSGYNLLAMIVEAVSGQAFSEYVREKVFEPAGITSAVFATPSQPVPIPERAWAYGIDEAGAFRREDDHFLDGLVGADGLYISVLDYYRWDQALRNASIVSTELHAQSLEPRTPISPRYNEMFEQAFDRVPLAPSEYGYGWFIAEEGGRRLAWHQGGWYGTQAMVIRNLEPPLTVAVFGNNDELSLGLVEVLFELAIEHLFEE